MYDIATEIISIADACLGGLQGRSALLIGPDKHRSPYLTILKRERMKNIFQEESSEKINLLLPHVQLLISMPDDNIISHPIPSPTSVTPAHSADEILVVEPHELQVVPIVPQPQITAGVIAQACAGRRTPLLIFDLAATPSIEELAGLLPAVCLYTPQDLQRILSKRLIESKAS